MRAWAEISAFGAVAVGAHIALWGALAGGGAPEGSGDRGEALVSLAASGGDVAALVAEWDEDPATAPTPHGFSEPPVPNDPSGAPTADRAPAPERMAALAPPLAPDGLIAAPDAPQPVLGQPETGEPAHLPAPATAGDDRPIVPGAVAPPPVPPRTAALPPPASAAPPVAADTPPAPSARPAPRPEQRAAGSGQGTARGTAGTAAASGLSDGARTTLIAAWGAEIRARVEARKEHPRGVAAGGRTVVRITISRDGTLEAVRVVRGSRVAALDEAAVRAVRRAGRFPAAPDRLDLARVNFDLPISFTR